MVTLSKLGQITPRAIFLAFSCLLGPLAFSQTTYYARQNGSWTTASTWSTTSCSGAAATTTPTSADNVVICAGRTVTWSGVTGNSITIKNLTINATGVLTINTGDHIYLNSLVLDGLVDGSSSGDLRMGNTTGCTLSGTGTYSVNNGSSDIRCQNNITILAGTDLKFDDDGTFRLNAKTVTNNGKISITTPSVFSGGGTFVNNTTTSYLFYSGGSFPNNTTLSAGNTGNTVEFKPTSSGRSVDRQGVYYNLVISGTAGTSANLWTATTIKGNLTINANATLSANAKNISIAGNWTDNGSFTESTGTVTFNGSANHQTVTAEQFYNLTINNTFSGGTVTALGNVAITNARTLTMTSGIFDMQTFTLNQISGSGKFTATGGELRLAKTGTTLPELTGTYTITGGTITFTGAGAQTVRALNSGTSSYYHIAFSGAGTKTLAGDITVRGNWTNAGSPVTGNFITTFGGTGTQTISNTSGSQTFYKLTANTTGPVTLATSTDVVVSNTLAMTAGNFNLNGQTLQVGSGSGAVLTRSAGICYGGFFKRYFPSATAISPTVGNLYGLFPVGSSASYRPVQVTSTANATTGGYVTVEHNDALTATDVSYNDNEGTAIQRVTDMNDLISTSGLVGGTYTLSVTMTSLSTQGVTTDLKLETQDGPPYGVGTHVATTGSTSSPVVARSSLGVTDFNHTFVVGTKNASTTPMVASYYSRRNGLWSDNTAGNATWSLTNGGPSCDCVPIASSMVYITPGTKVTVSSAAKADFIFIQNNATLAEAGGSLTVNYDLITQNSGKLTTTSGGTTTISRDMILTGTGASSSELAIVVSGDLQIDAGASLSMNNSLSVAGDEITIDGTLAMGTKTLTLTGANATISGSAGVATITGTSAANISISSAKTIVVGSNLTIQPNITLAASTTVTNAGTVTHSGNLVGTNATTSIWVNDSNSSYSTTGTVLTTGILNTDAVPNTVNYNGSGAQTIKVPNTTYYNLLVSNAGTKTTGGNITVDNSLTIQDAAILSSGTNTFDGAGDVTMTGTSQWLISKTTTGTYPEMTGAYTLTGGTITLSQGAAGTFSLQNVDYYNLILSGSSSAVFDFPNGGNVTNDMSVTLGGTAIMNIASGLTVADDFTFNSSSTGTSTIASDITVGTFTFSAGKISTAGATTVEITGDGGWTYNGGTWTQGTTSVLFSGANDQSIGGSTNTTFTNMEINNGGATGLILSKGLTVTGAITFTAGNLVTSSSNMFVMSAGSAYSGVSNDSYVEGPMQKTGNTDFTFPVGKDGEYRPIGISSISVSSTFQAEYFHSNPDASYSLASKDATLIRMQTSEYWILAPTVVGPQAFVTLSWDDYSGTVDDLSSIKVARWNGTTWKDHGNGGTTGAVSPATGTVRTSAIVTSFSPFTLASGNGNNPLPVELLSFTAKLDGTRVLLDWKTASEIDNKYFTVDKTKDTRKFAEVARVQGAGTTNLASTYSAVDETPYAGVSYYRLRQTDFDGHVSDQGMVAVNNTGGSETQTVIVFPNPAQNVPMNVNLRGYESGEQVAFDVKDAKGQTVLSRALQVENTGELMYTFDTTSLTSGIYILIVRGSLGPVSVKVVVP